jgi:hypothetical protein
LNPGLNKSVDGIEDHPLVIHWQQMLVRDLGKREQTTTGTPARITPFIDYPLDSFGLILTVVTGMADKDARAFTVVIPS